MKTRENNMQEEQEPNLSVEESISIRFGDITISISANDNGILSGKTNEQIIKFCADLLLRTTDSASLENFLDTALSVEETLREDFNMKPLEISQFLNSWRKRLYLKQIGEQNPPIEQSISGIRAVEPSSDEELGDVVTPTPTRNGENGIAITIPLDKKITHPDVKAPDVKILDSKTFTIIEKDK